ncbi:UNVERIFIED_CONTAM: hypothetical protein GTU68_054188 [Idotea baltica]|nr:hypothetical protein [Idotea baltica]
MQIVRSFKIRGAYNKIKSLTDAESARGVICASAGNHAQGVAFACNKLKIKGTIFMPNPTPTQKVNKVKQFGKDWVTVILHGDSFDDAHQAATHEANIGDAVFIHPFDDQNVIAGQGTIALEMIKQQDDQMDYVFVAVGGGGLISGVGSCYKQLYPETQIIAVEAMGAPALGKSLEAGTKIQLNDVDVFADGIAVKEVGDLTFEICKEVVDDHLTVSEGKICSTILNLYNEDAIVVEPAGAISIAALDKMKAKIKGRNVGIIVCGGNNDISRTPEIAERSLLFEGKKHYFLIHFPQRAGALKEFLMILGPDDDITHFEYMKKTNRVKGAAIVGIELKDPKDFYTLVDRMTTEGINFQHINDNPLLFEMFI